MEVSRHLLIFSLVFLCFSLCNGGKINKRSLSANSVTHGSHHENVLNHNRRKRAVFSADDQQAILDKHNEMRREPLASNMEKLEWNLDLAEMAEQWAKSCSWQHGQPNSSNLANEHIGQNRYAVFGTFDALEGIQEWWNGHDNYDHEAGRCKDGQDCESYTQLVWGNTREVGCAFAFCSSLEHSDLENANYLVCNYRPAGNWAGQKPFKMGPQCSECYSGNGWCSDGLCSGSCAGQTCECKAYCRNCGTLDADDCSCQCKPGYFGPSCADKCADKLSYCGSNAEWSTCDANHQYVLDNCPLMCGLCTAGAIEGCDAGTTTPDPRVHGDGAVVPGPTTRGYEADFIPIYFEPAVEPIMWVGIGLGIICVIINIFGIIWCCGCRKRNHENYAKDNKMYEQE